MADDGPSSRERIIDATYEALIDTGYADLTMSDIAAKSGTSTALLHYHFDTKEDLLVAFLDDLIDGLEERFAAEADTDPTTRLFDVLSLYVLDPSETERASFHVALVELRGQAPYNARYRERLRRADALVMDELVDVLETGMTAGVVREVDPEAIATHLLVAVDGARTRAIALGEPAYTSRVRDVLYENLLADILTADGRERWTELVDR